MRKGLKAWQAGLITLKHELTTHGELERSSYAMVKEAEAQSCRVWPVGPLLLRRRPWRDDLGPGAQFHRFTSLGAGKKEAALMACRLPAIAPVAERVVDEEPGAAGAGARRAAVLRRGSAGNTKGAKRGKCNHARGAQGK